MNFEIYCDIFRSVKRVFFWIVRNAEPLLYSRIILCDVMASQAQI